MNILVFNISPLILLLFPHAERQFSLAIASKKFAQLFLSIEIYSQLSAFVCFFVLYFSLAFRVLSKPKGCATWYLPHEAVWTTAVTGGQYIWEMVPHSCTSSSIRVDHIQSKRDFDSQLDFCPLGNTLRPEHLFSSISPDSWSLEMIISAQLGS